MATIEMPRLTPRRAVGPGARKRASAPGQSFAPVRPAPASADPLDGCYYTRDVPGAWRRFGQQLRAYYWPAA